MDKTNTDKTCLANPSNRFAKLVYSYNIWSGLYMLEPWERALFNGTAIVATVLGWSFVWKVWELGWEGVREEMLVKLGVMWG